MTEAGCCSEKRLKPLRSLRRAAEGCDVNRLAWWSYKGTSHPKGMTCSEEIKKNCKLIKRSWLEVEKYMRFRDVKSQNYISHIFNKKPICQWIIIHIRRIARISNRSKRFGKVHISPSWPCSATSHSAQTCTEEQMKTWYVFKYTNPPDTKIHLQTITRTFQATEKYKSRH